MNGVTRSNGCVSNQLVDFVPVHRCISFTSLLFISRKGACAFVPLPFALSSWVSLTPVLCRL